MEYKLFLDTNALLNLQSAAFKEKFVISQKTLEEIESIKTSGHKDGDVKYKTRSESEEINKIKLAFLLCIADNKSRELLVKVVNCDEEYRFDRGLGCCQRRSPC